MPTNLTVQANVPEKKDKDGKVTQPAVGPFSINVSTGESAAESISMFGDEAVKSNSDANWVVTVQGNMRAGMKKGETEEQLQARLGSAKMGITQRGVQIDPKQKFLADFAAATPDEQRKMVAELKAMAKG